MDAHLSVIERAAAAVGARLILENPPASVPDEPYADDEIANRLYQIGRLASKRITASKLQQFELWLQQARERVGDYPYFREWLALVERGPDSVAKTFADPTEFGRYMRSVATFRPFISQQERDSFFRPERLTPAS